MLPREGCSGLLLRGRRGRSWEEKGGSHDRGRGPRKDEPEAVCVFVWVVPLRGRRDWDPPSPFHPSPACRSAVSSSKQHHPQPALGTAGGGRVWVSCFGAG
jgi:hypothetical protein